MCYLQMSKNQSKMPRFLLLHTEMFKCLKCFLCLRKLTFKYLCYILMRKVVILHRFYLFYLHKLLKCLAQSLDNYSRICIIFGWIIKIIIFLNLLFNFVYESVIKSIEVQSQLFWLDSPRFANFYHGTTKKVTSSNFQSLKQVSLNLLPSFA